MSAYDNPTIIKDESAMIWAQGLGGAGQAFMESFKASRKEREAREKEARLDAERRAKESKEVQINKQIAASNTTKKINAERDVSQSDFAKAGVSPSLSEQALNFSEKIKTKIGDNNQNIMFNMVEPDVLKSNAKFENLYASIWGNMNRILGVGGAEVKSIADGTWNQTNINKLEYNGKTDPERFRSFATSNSLALNKDVVSAIDYDENDLSKGARAIIRTSGYDENKIKNAMKSINPDIANNDTKFNKFLEDAKASGILQEGEEKDGKKSYTVVYDMPIDDKTTGSFFTVIPDATKEKDLQTANIYNDKGQLYDTFLGGVKYIKAENNAGLDKSEIDAKIESRSVNMADIEALIKERVRVNVTGLLATDLQDTNKLRGFMTSLKLGTSPEMVDNFLGEKLEEQINTLSEPIIEKYRDNIMKENNIVKTKDGYMQVDRANVTKFSVSQKNSTNKQTATQKAKAATWTEQRKAILDMELGGLGDFYSPDGKRKVSYNGTQFIIQTAGTNEEVAIPTKAGVVEYLEKGTLTSK